MTALDGRHAVMNVGTTVTVCPGRWINPDPGETGVYSSIECQVQERKNFNRAAYLEMSVRFVR